METCRVLAGSTDILPVFLSNPEKLLLQVDIKEILTFFEDEKKVVFLEGVGKSKEVNTQLGLLYIKENHPKLPALFLEEVDEEILLAALPKQRVQERAVLLKKLGRHEEGIQILVEAGKLDEAKLYCERENVYNFQSKVPHSKTKTPKQNVVPHSKNKLSFPILLFHSTTLKTV